MPRNHEKNAAIVGLRHHNRGIRGLETAVENDVHALARGYRHFGSGIVETTNRIGEDSCRIDHHRCVQVVLTTRLGICRSNTHDLTVFFEQAVHRHIIDEGSPMIGGRHR